MSKTVDFVSRDFWKDKRVFLTGHTGFKGAWLSLWLADMGAEIYGYSLAPPTTPNLFEIAGVSKIVRRHHVASVHDPLELDAAIERAEPEIVIHMAAQAIVRRGYLNPIDTYMTNVMGTVHLLEACRKRHSISAILVVTTDKCYENREWQWGYREVDLLGGRDPYSNSKACAELVTAAYRKSFYELEPQTSVATARAGNVIGGGDWASDRLIPDLIRAHLAGSAPVIRSPNAIRPWQHVLEPLSGYLMLCQGLYEHRETMADAWNFGPALEDARPVSWIANRVANLWNGDAKWKLDTDRHPHEANYLYLDTTKARKILGYKPRWPLSVALEQVVTWHKGMAVGSDMAALTLQQVREFESTDPVTCHDAER